MRVLALTNLYPNPYQPLRAPFIRQLLRALGKQVPVHVISPIAWMDELAGRKKGGILPPSRRVTLDGLTVDHPRYLYTPKAFRYWYGPFFRRSVQSTFSRALRDFQPDVVFAPWIYPDGWAAVELGHSVGLPVVLKAYGSDIRVLRHYRGRKRRTIEALQRADALVAVSQELATQMMLPGVSPEKIHVAYSGVDAELFHPGSRQEARSRLGLIDDASIILFIGNLLPVKGIDVLVDACSRLARAGTEYTCYLIGQGPLRSGLEREVARLGLSDRIQFLGPRPHHQLPDWFRAANVFTLPSRSEGMPNVLLEALACGTPFVASRVGGIPELVNLGPCRLVAPENAGELAESLTLSLQESKARTGTDQVIPKLRNYDDEASELASLLKKVHQEYHSIRPNCVSS